MSKGGPVSEAEESEILEALKAGKTTREVADEFQRSRSTISDVARRNGLDLAELARMKKSDIARTCYASEARIKLIGRVLDKAEALLKACENPRDLQALMMTVAIGIDKRRLEESTDTTGRGGEIQALFEKMGEGET